MKFYILFYISMTFIKLDYYDWFIKPVRVWCREKLEKILLVILLIIIDEVYNMYYLVEKIVFIDILFLKICSSIVSIINQVL